MMAKTSRERAAESYQRRRRGTPRKAPIVVNWEDAWDRLDAMLADLYGNETPETSTGTG